MSGAPDIKVPLSDVELGEPEIAAVTEVLRSKWLTSGAMVGRFEAALAERHGVPHALAVANCTAALHMAYLALGVGPGDEVLVPTLSFVASANMVRLIGAVPVFVDATSERDFNVDVSDLERKITPRTKAITVVHYAGYGCNMEALLDVAGRRGLPLVEDCAHAPGGTFQGRPLGSFGAVSCFSFFGNKNMTTGEGGAVLTKDAELLEKLRLMRSHGMTTMTWDRHRGHAFSYDVLSPGHNFRLDEMRAAMGLAQLDRLAGNNLRRGQAVRLYRRAMATKLPQVVVPFADRQESTFHIFPVLLPPGTDRTAVMTRLKEAGIQSSVHYPPTHMFSGYRGLGATLPVAEALAPRILTLPLFPSITAEQIGLVVDTLAAALA